MMPNETLFYLDVWQPACLDRRLAYNNQESDDSRVNILNKEELYEQVYSWKLEGDVWTALGHDDDAKQLKEDLTNGFSFELPPKERSFTKMQSIIQQLESILQNTSNRQWQSWKHPEGDPDNLFQMQPLLSLYHYLSWLCDVFQDVPGASITIR